MLEVVEHEQQRAFSEVVEQLILRREAAVHGVDGELNRLGDRRREEVRLGDGGEGDEVNPMRIAIAAPSGGFEREPGLTRAARPDKGDQAAFGVIEQAVDLVELCRTADERRP
jgi:hypothetical protein